MAGKLFLAALGALLGRSKASKAPTRAPRARQEASRDEKETPGVDFGRRFGSKNDDFWRLFRLPVVLLACFRFSFSALFMCFLAVHAKGRKAKFDTRSERNRVFSRCALAPALPQGRQPMVKNRFQNRMEKINNHQKT